jgi:hypothetical protein
MSHRDISGTILRSCFGAVRKEATPSKLLNHVLEEIASAQRDLDITGDIDSADYYAGMIDAYVAVAQWIAPVKKEKEGLFSQLLDYVHFTGATKIANKIPKENAS